jgi:cell division protein FtsB
MSKFAGVVAVGLLFVLAVPSSAQERQDDVAALKARVDKLEAENTAIKKEIAEVKKQLTALGGSPATGPRKPKLTDEEEKVTLTANEFVADLEKGRLASAYLSTSDTYQKRTARKAFDELVEAQPILKKLAKTEHLREHKIKKLPKGKAYEYYLTSAELGNGDALGPNLLNMTLRLIDEEGEWKVDEIEIKVTKR